MKKMLLVSVLGLITLLSACSYGESTEQKLSDILTDIYESEKGYRDVQVSLVEMEKKEQSNFQSMMELTQDQKEELTKQVDATAKLLEERLAIVKKESTSIKLATDKMADIEKLIANTKEEAKKESLVHIQKALENRYTAYENVTEQYNSLASLQEELYTMLVKEDVEIAIIQEKVQEVNTQNDVVQKAVEKFNELTNQLNKVKEEVFTALQKAKK